MLRLDKDAQSMQSFAARVYFGEIHVQKTVVRDLLGGEYHGSYTTFHALPPICWQPLRSAQEAVAASPVGLRYIRHC